MTQARLDRAAHDAYFAADQAASVLPFSLNSRNGNVRETLQFSNTGDPRNPGQVRDWGPAVGTLDYADSTMRYYGEIERMAQDHSLARSQSR